MVCIRPSGLVFRLCALCAFAGFWCIDAAAQDSSAVAGKRAEPVVAPRIAFSEPRRGVAVTDTLPARLPAVDLTELLADVPGSFTYLFGTEGWPDGWSAWGLPPESSTLLFDERPFTHVFTGRPAFGLVPLAFIEPPRLEAGRLGHPVAVLARLRPFDAPRPLTEGRYWRGGDGLQSIDAVHVQNRRRSLFGHAGFLRLMGAYSGRAATGEYPGSALRRGRQLHLRAVYEQEDWSLEILNVHNRRRVGAHGGVVPFGDFETIYVRTGAEVEHPEAERRIIRNDLSATIRLRMGAEPSTATGYWTAESFGYEDLEGSMPTRSHRLGFRLRQPLVARHLSAHVEGWAERVSMDEDARSGGVLHAYVRDSLGLAGWSGVLTGGAGIFDGGIHPAASVSISHDEGRMGGSLAISLSHRPRPILDEVGYGSLSGLANAPSGGTILARGEVVFRSGAFDAALGASASRESDPVDYYAVSDTVSAVLAASSAFMRAGVYADVGWRRAAERGLYLIFRPTMERFLNPDDSPLHRRSADALPTAWASGRLGLRYLLFRGDLDLDVYVEAFAWPGFHGRTLHPESGLLVVALEDSRDVEASSMVNFVVEAGIRDAKVFLTYENALSGTALLTGNMMVPVYPLPAQRFRLGVYWPIFD